MLESLPAGSTPMRRRSAPTSRSMATPASTSSGLPSPLVFMAAAAERTRHLMLATGIITLPLEHPLRLAEDAAVLDVITGGRLELGFGTGGSEVVFSLFDRQVDNRQADYDRAFFFVRDALLGKPLTPDGPTLWPPAERLVRTFWEAAMSMRSAVRAAEHGSGLLLARTHHRAPAEQHRSLGDIQSEMIQAYLDAWPEGDLQPRVGLSRSVYVAETRAQALADAEPGMRRHAEVLSKRSNVPLVDASLDELIARSDLHIGTPEDVIRSLQADPTLAPATDLTLQVHPVDPEPDKTLRSFELIAREVAPALGWRPLTSH